MGVTRKRYNIGLIVGDIEDDFSSRICEGAMEAAQRLDVNLFILPAKYLLPEEERIDSEVKYEYQYNTLISYAKSKSLDYVLCALSSVGYKVTKKETDRVLEQLAGVPMMTLSCQEEGYPAVLFDNKKGIVEGMEAWIARGITKIGMIYGTPENLDARERFEAYKETLDKHGIKFNDRYVVQGDYTSKCKGRLAKWYCENKDLEAIVVMTDTVANVFYEVLNEAGVQIGKDIYVFGYDDLETSKHMDPPLATVKAMPREFGRVGVETALKYLRGEVQGEQSITYVDTEFITRESADGIKRQIPPESRKELHRYKDAFESYIDFSHQLNNINRDILMLEDMGENPYAERLERFNVRGVTTCFFFTYYQEIEVESYETWVMPENVYLMAYKHGEHVGRLERDEQRISVDDIFDNPYLPDERKTYLIIDIYARKMQYGIFMCDLPFEYYHYAEFICYMLGATTKVGHLLKIQQGLMDEKEVYLRQLKKENEKLNNLSYMDLLTGLYNRRGVFHQAKNHLENLDNFGKNAYAMYMDLNYLKKINDQYGHEEGDSAIQFCAEALKAVLPKDSIVGRIGGDEFAALIISEESADSFYNALREYFDRENEQTKRGYRLSASVGMYGFTVKENVAIEFLLEHADQLLYEDKKNKPTWK